MKRLDWQVSREVPDTAVSGDVIGGKLDPVYGKTVELEPSTILAFETYPVVYSAPAFAPTNVGLATVTAVPEKGAVAS